jgi:hypothetical protein
MQRFTINSYYDDEDMIFVPSSLGGVIDFDNSKFEVMLRKIINMPEYWRMKHIGQLGFVQYVIPYAFHSRLEHCIGAFDLMRDLIYRSNRNYGKTNVESWNFNDKEWAAQAAAFLHDIGHAYPGHPFERAIKKMFPDSYKNHEKWSLEIIQRSKILKTLNSYSAGFGNRVLDIMAEDNLDNSIWQQVHCGNLNVDTMDYLHRDQSRTRAQSDIYMMHRIIENVRFDKTADEKPCVVLCPGAEMDFMKMLHIRGEMYSEIYLNGKPAAAEAFLPDFFVKIGDALGTEKYRQQLKGLYNPFIEFIDSKGTNYKAYLNLVGESFNHMIIELARLKIEGVSDFAQNLMNVEQNFECEYVYKGDALDIPDDIDVAAAEADTKARGGIFKDVSVPLYDKKKPEVYCMMNKIHKLSDLYPEFADRKIRIISKFFMNER